MNKVAQRIAKTLFNHNLLKEYTREEYIYVIEILIEKIISFGTLLILSLLLKNIVETIVFLFVFLNMRERTGGFHMNSYGKCWMLTIVLYISMLYIFIPFLYKIGIYSYFVFSVSILIILIISTINHPNMQLSNSELIELKRVARLTAGIHWFSLTVFFFVMPQNKCILWAMGADIVCGTLLIVAKLVKQEVI